MHHLNPSVIEDTFKHLFDEFGGLLSWKWDDWIGTILAEFNSDKKEDVHAILEKLFPFSWDSSNIDAAPQVVRTVDKHLGELRPEQLLFGTLPSQDTIVFCAWWPWGNGMTISIRIAFFDKNLSKSEENMLMDKLKVFAGI